MEQAPAVHVQVHALSLLKATKVSRHLGLLHGLALQFVQMFDELDAWVIFAVDKSLFSHLQVQLVQSCLSQQPPGNKNRPLSFPILHFVKENKKLWEKMGGS